MLWRQIQDPEGHGMIGYFILLGSLAQPQPAPDPARSEEAAILAVVDRMFDAMRRRDAEAYAALLVPEGMAIRVRTDGPAEGRLRFRGNAEDIALFKEGTDMWDERIWNPTVHVHGPIAVVWAPYDFHINGKFSHCGVDLFELLNVDGAWRLSNASWTVETVGCPPSPLGPLKAATE